MNGDSSGISALMGCLPELTDVPASITYAAFGGASIVQAT